MLLILLTSVARAEDDSAAKARNAIGLGLGFLEKDGVAWIKEKQCISCHHVPFLLWSCNEARVCGLSIDAAKVAEWTERSWKFSRTRREWFKLTAESLKQAGALPIATSAKLAPVLGKPFVADEELLAELARNLSSEELQHCQTELLKRAARPPEPTNDGGGLDTLAQLLLGRATDARGMDPAFIADLENLIVRWQQPDGSWKAAGQLPSLNRPEWESNVVTTRWVVLALATIDHPSSPTREAIAKAVAFLKAAKPGTSTESLATALLVEQKFGRPDTAAGLLSNLRTRQNRDGGWSWRLGGDSDAFASGQTLYALRRFGVAADDAAVKRAGDFLIRTQAADGSWPEAARAISKPSNETRLKKVAPIYRYWGSAWAVIGLTQTLP